jgi:hypothetical protein
MLRSDENQGENAREIRPRQYKKQHAPAATLKEKRGRKVREGA